MKKGNLKIVFMGTPEFAVPALDALNNHYDIVGIITAPDKPSGRGLQLNVSPVKKFALEKGFKILQPGNLKDPSFLNELKALNPDLQIVVAFRMLPEIVWNMPPLGTINLHASLLPQYRGAAPINRAIMNGESITGLTTFKLKKEIDTGQIIFQKKIEIDPYDNAGTLHDKIKTEGAQLILETVKAIESGNYPLIDQGEIQGNKELKIAPKIFKEDCKINWRKSSVEIHNQVRGLSPFPGAFSEFISDSGKSIIKIYRSSPEEMIHSLSPGTIESDFKSWLKVATGNGFLKILELQPEGKKRMTIKEYLNGIKLNPNLLFIY